jgi:hypothetical protein
MVMERTKEMWTPRERCVPEHDRQKKMPNLGDALKFLIRVSYRGGGGRGGRGRRGRRSKRKREKRKREKREREKRRREWEKEGVRGRRRRGRRRRGRGEREKKEKKKRKNTHPLRTWSTTVDTAIVLIGLLNV